MSEAADIKVSVIVPVYNAEKTIGECLDCIAGQTLREIEIICVDDGSQDSSLQKLREYAERDPRVKALHQENQGAGIARNTGLKEAKGKFLSFLDADDRFEKDLLESAYTVLEETRADICAYAADSFDTNTGETVSYNAAFDKKYVPEKRAFCPASDEHRETVMQMFNGVPWSKMFRADFIRESGLQYQRLRTTNDAFFVYSAMCKARKIATINRILVHRRKNDGVSLTQTRDLSWRCFYEALTAIRDELIRSGLYARFERTFLNRALKNVIWNMDTLSAESADQIAALMKNEGFARLGIDRHAADYYYDQRSYEQYTWIRDLDEDGLRTVREVARQRDELAKKNRELKNELKALKNSASYKTGEHLLAGPKGIRKLFGKKA